MSRATITASPAKPVLADLPVRAIGPDPQQPRKTIDPEAIARLAASMERRGQLQPVRVWARKGMKSYVLVCGERRWTAAKRLGWERIRAEIVPKPDCVSLLIDQIVENCAREEIPPLELADALKQLSDLGMSHREIAEATGLSQGHVSRTLSLLALASEVRRMVGEGKLAASTAAELTKLWRKADQVELAREAWLNGWSRQVMAAAVTERTCGPRTPDASPAIADAGPIEAAAEHLAAEIRAATPDGRDLPGQLLMEHAEPRTSVPLEACRLPRPATQLEIRRLMPEAASTWIPTDAGPEDPRELLFMVPTEAGVAVVTLAMPEGVPPRGAVGVLSLAIREAASRYGAGVEAGEAVILPSGLEATVHSADADDLGFVWVRIPYGEGEVTQRVEVGELRRPPAATTRKEAAR